MLQLLLITVGCSICGLSGFIAWRCFSWFKIIIFSVFVIPIGIHTAIVYPWPGCLSFSLFMCGYILGIFWKISIISSQNKKQFSPILINGGRS